MVKVAHLLQIFHDLSTVSGGVGDMGSPIRMGKPTTCFLDLCLVVPLGSPWDGNGFSCGAIRPIIFCLPCDSKLLVKQRYLTIYEARAQTLSFLPIAPSPKVLRAQGWGSEK